MFDLKYIMSEFNVRNESKKVTIIRHKMKTMKKKKRKRGKNLKGSNDLVMCKCSIRKYTQLEVADDTAAGVSF